METGQKVRVRVGSMKDIWNEATAESALMYMRDSDEDFARAKARVMALEKQEKIIFGAEYLETDGSVDERKGKAHNSIAYKEWAGEYDDAVLDFNTLYAKRTTKAAYLEAWRSVYSARKRGNV